MIELSKEQFGMAAPLLMAAPHNKPVVFSVIERRQPGRVFVDDRGNPTIALVTFDDYIFLAGTNPAALNRSFYEYIIKEILAKSDLEFFEFYTYAEPFYERTVSILCKEIIDRRIRKTFALDTGRYKHLGGQSGQPPEGLSLERIDARSIDRLKLSKAFWDPASQRFGYCLCEDDAILSQCVAVFIGASMVEVGIDTHEHHRRRGYAMLTARAFIDHCLAEGLTPNWTCWDFRDASIALAHKLGFYCVNDTRVLVLKADKSA